MRIALIVLVFLAMPAWAQVPAAKPATAPKSTPTTKNAASAPAETCTECGVIQSIRAITKKAAQNSNHFSSFVLGIVNSPAFQMSTAEAVTTTAQ